MSHIPGLHRQPFGTPLTSIFLITLTLLLQIVYTGSDDTSTTALLSLLSILTFGIVIYVAQTDFIVVFALRVVVSWCTIVFQRTLVLCSSVKYVSDSLVNLDRSPFARTWTAISAIIDLIVEVPAFTLSLTCSTKSGLELLEEGLLLPDESLLQHQSQEASDPPSSPPVRPEVLRTAILSTPSPSLATCPPPTNAPLPHSYATWTSSFARFGDYTNGPNAIPFEPATSPGLFSNDVVVHANDDRKETTSGSTIISRGSRSNQLDVALVAPINRTAKSNASSVRKSSVPFPPLSNLPGDTGLTGQTDPDGSRKIAQQNLKFVNVDILRGPVLAATAPRRAGTILPPLSPCIVIHAISTASFCSSGSQKYTASTSSSPHSISTSTFQTTATTTPCSSQIDLHSDVEGKVPGAPTATAITTADVELPKNDDAENQGEVATSPFVRLRDHQTGSGRRSKIPELETAENAAQNDDDWQWAKTKGKQPERGEEDDVDEEEDEDEDENEDEEDYEEDYEDEQGFSTRLMRKTMAKSKRAAPGGVARLFYGASTSTVVKGPLSQAEWDMLEQFEALPSSPKKVVRSPSPAPTGVEAEIAVPCWLSAPLPPLPEVTSIKAKRIPRLRKLFKKILASNPFKNRSRAR